MQIPVCNLTQREILIGKHTELGTMQQVQSVTPLTILEGEEKTGRYEKVKENTENNEAGDMKPPKGFEIIKINRKKFPGDLGRSALTGKNTYTSSKNESLRAQSIE